MRLPTFVLLSFTIFLTAAGCAKTTSLPASQRQIEIGQRILNVEIADTDQLREAGLSGRQKLRDDEGILFLFFNSREKKPGFWMKGMKFDLDLIWINHLSQSQGKVVAITPEVPAPTDSGHDVNLPVYFPPSEVDAVLEVNSGWSKNSKLKVGDSVNLK